MSDKKTVAVALPKADEMAKEYSLPVTDAQQILASFSEVAERMAEADKELQVFGNPEEITPEVCQEARRLRLIYQKIRTRGDDIHKEVKAGILLRTKAIDGTRNLFKLQVSEREEGLAAIEKHYERIEEEKREKVRQERAEKLLELGIKDVEHLMLADMSPDVWEAFYGTKKKERDDRIAAEKAAEEKAEAERKAQELLNKRTSEILSAGLGDFFNKDLDLKVIDEKEYKEQIDAAKKAKAEHEAEQKKIAEENAKLKAEAEAKAKKEEEERKAREAEEAKKAAALEEERKKKEAELQAERDKAAAAQKELEDKRAEEARLKAEAEAKQAEESRAKKNKAYLDFLERNGASQKDIDAGSFIVQRDGSHFHLYKLVDTVQI